MPLNASTQELLRIAKEEAASLAADAPVSEPREMTVHDYLALLAKDEKIPAGIKAALAKVTGIESWSGSTVVAFTAEMYTDPWQLKPVTLAEVSLGSTSSGSPSSGSTFSSNEMLQKRQELADKVTKSLADMTKLIEGKTDAFATALRTEITKAGPATSKLEQVKAVLAIKTDVDDSDLRWRVSQLVGMLAEHAAVERMFETEVEKTEVGKAAAPEPVVKANACAFPANLADAEFDSSTGRFKHADVSWGRDNA